jgi:hypothetical protein
MPNLFIVGAPKAGTTSLYKYLSKHKSIFFPAIKEPHFLYRSRVKSTVNGTISDYDEYRSLYENSEEYRYQGDASVYGLLYSAETIRNIKLICGENAKIIILLRHPVERAYAAYLHVRRNNDDKELESFVSAFKQNSDGKSLNPMRYYRQCSLYCDAIKNYKKEFNDVRVVYSDDLFENTKEELVGVYKFLGLEYSEALFEGLGKHNEGGKDLSNPAYSYLLKKIFNYDFRIAIKKYFPASYLFLKKNAFKFLFKEAAKLSSEEYTDVSRFFVDDIKCLFELLGDRQLEAWGEELIRKDGVTS